MNIYPLPICGHIPSLTLSIFAATPSLNMVCPQNANQSQTELCFVGRSDLGIIANSAACPQARDSKFEQEIHEEIICKKMPLQIQFKAAVEGL